MDLLLQTQFIIDFSPHLVAASIFIFSSLLLFVAAKSVKKVWVAATLPIALCIVATLIVAIHSISGQPTEREWKGEFQYLAYAIDPDFEYIYIWGCLLYTSPSPRDRTRSRMPSSA